MKKRENAPVSTSSQGKPRLEDRLRTWSSKSVLAQKSVALYKEHQRFVPAAFFFGGVAWDSATLNRIDAWLDSSILLAYIIALGAFILIALCVEQEKISKPFFLKHRSWYPLAIQFLMGALFSAYFIFYMQSASFRSESIIFIIILAALLISNEFLRDKLLNAYVLFALYYLASVSFFIFFLPVAFKVMGYGIFLVSCLIGLAIVGGMLFFLLKRDVIQEMKRVYKIGGMVLGIFALLNLFYMQNWIPPVPLSMKEGAIYRGLERKGDAFALLYAQPEWCEFWVDSDREFFYAEGDTVYTFAAVFAPTELETQIYHAWHHFDESQQAWVQTDEIAVNIEGGRDAGYRTYTRKRRVSPGRWRVDVKTEFHQILGRIPFTIIPVDSTVTTFAYRYYE